MLSSGSLDLIKGHLESMASLYHFFLLFLFQRQTFSSHHLASEDEIETVYTMGLCCQSSMPSSYPFPGSIKSKWLLTSHLAYH